MLDMSQWLFKLFNCILQHDLFALESKVIILDFPISSRAGQFHHHTGLMDGVRVGHQQCLLHHICYSERSLLDSTISPSSQSKPSLFTIHWSISHWICSLVSSCSSSRGWDNLFHYNRLWLDNQVNHVCCSCLSLCLAGRTGWGSCILILHNQVA